VCLGDHFTRPSVIGVATYPGQAAVAVTPRVDSSLLSELHSEINPACVAL
jgi:hypothetical protein